MKLVIWRDRHEGYTCPELSLIMIGRQFQEDRHGNCIHNGYYIMFTSPFKKKQAQYMNTSIWKEEVRDCWTKRMFATRNSPYYGKRIWYTTGPVLVPA